MGQVVGHPLADWSALQSYEPPDLLQELDFGLREDWERVQQRLATNRQNGKVTIGGVGHGFLLMRLFYLRGYENLMIDLIEEPPELDELIQIVVDRNMALVRKWLELSVDVVGFGEDLGSQNRLLLTPKYFRRYIKPCYRKLFGAVREAGIDVYFHSDGYLLEILDDLNDCGVTILNPQVNLDPELKVNGLENIIEKCKGKVCVDLDFDRQIFPFCTPDKIHRDVREVVTRLGSPEGGLMLHAACLPGVPLENIEAICEAILEYRFYYSHID